MLSRYAAADLLSIWAACSAYGRPAQHMGGLLSIRAALMKMG